MGFFGKSVRTDKMIDKPTTLLPHLSTVGGMIIVAALLAPCSLPEPVNGDTAPTNNGPYAAGGHDQAAQDLLAKAILILDRHRSVSASIIQEGNVFGRKTVGEGAYLQQRVDGKPLFHLELRIQVGDDTSSLVHVRDGNGHLWIYQKLPGNVPELTRIDVKRVEQVMAETGHSPLLGQVGKWPGLGGLSKLLRGLHDSFQFTHDGEMLLEGQRRVWKLRGRWKTYQLARLLPDQQEAIEAGQPADLDRLPQHAPDQVVLFLGKEDLFPYRLEFLRRQSERRDGKKVAVDRPIAILRLYQVSFNVPIPPESFRFSAGLEHTDRTAEFLRELGVEE